MKDIITPKLRKYTIIKSILFDSDLYSDTYECNLTMSLCKDEKYPEDKVIIDFMGVANLSINKIGGGLSQILRLDIVDMRDHQWENIHYHVFDYENDAISFYCRDIKIVNGV